MRKLLYILLPALLAGWASGATGAAGDLPSVPVIPAELADAPLDSVTIAGIDSILAAGVRTVLLSAGSGILNSGLVEHDITAAGEYLRERGWWRAGAAAEIDSTHGLVLRFLIDLGPPSYIGRITLSGDEVTVLPEGAAGMEGQLFGRASLDSLIVGITGSAAQSGYPGAVVEPALSARGDTVDVALAVTTGTRAHIDSIAVLGLTRTNDRVVRRELAWIVGQPAGIQALDEAQATLRRLEYLRIDGAPVIEYDDANRGILAVRVIEIRQGTFDGVLGYQPGINGESGELVGRFLLDMANMFGTGRAALVRWENLGNNSEDLELRYTEPWVLGRPWDISGSFLQEERGIQGYTRTGMSLAIGRRIGDIRANIGAQYEKISADSLHSASAAGGEISLSWTVLDDRVNPSNGFRYGLSWSSLAREWRFRNLPRTRVSHVGIDLEQYIPTFSRQTLAIAVQYRNVTVPADRMAPADRYWLGGSTTIRGYAEHLLPAVKAGWVNIEYRFLTGASSRVFLFTDIGHLVDRREEDGAFKTNVRTVAGYGFGIRLSARTGTLGFDYGLSRDDTITGGKVHVSLSTDF